MLFPTLVDDIASLEAREAFKVETHLFYPQRVVDFVGDGADKWEGVDGKSAKVDDHGNRITS